jgi:hypothetical protein
MHLFENNKLILVLNSIQVFPAEEFMFQPKYSFSDNLTMLHFSSLNSASIVFLSDLDINYLSLFFCFVGNLRKGEVRK